MPIQKASNLFQSLSYTYHLHLLHSLSLLDTHTHFLCQDKWERKLRVCLYVCVFVMGRGNEWVRESEILLQKIFWCSTPAPKGGFLQKTGSRMKNRGRLSLLHFELLFYTHTVWQDWAIFYTLGNFSKPGAIIILPKSPTHFRQILERCQNLSLY